MSSVLGPTAASPGAMRRSEFDEDEVDAVHELQKDLDQIDHEARTGVPKTQQRTLQLDAEINLENLQKLKAAFDEADVDGGGGLDIDEFTEAFTFLMPGLDRDAQREAVMQLFCKIDANSDGAISWDEFSSYMMLENQGSAKLRETELSLQYVRDPKLERRGVETEAHREAMMAACLVPTQLGINDKYVSGGKDGTIKVWSARGLRPLRTIPVASAWITGLRYCPRSQRVVSSLFNRTIKLFDAQNMDVCGGASDLEHAPLSLETWFSARKGTELLCTGDVGGQVILYDLVERLEEEKGSDERFGLTRMWKNKVHKDWVSSVCYVTGVNYVASASLDSTIAMLDANRKTVVKRLEGHTKGIFSVAWSEQYNFMVSGGMDRTLLLWNPYSNRPMAALTGHTASISKILINDRENQVLSLSVDKTIKVWDVRNHRCLQTLVDTTKYRPEDTVSTMFFDPARRCLVTGTTYLKLWPLRSIISTGASAHSKPVACAIWNPTFKEAVSGDHEGVVCVWDVRTGNMKFRFQGAHGRDRITTMAFDRPGRRLITGSDTGDLKGWNYSSGSALRRYTPAPGRAAGREVTGVVASAGLYSGQFLVSVGWNKKVTFYDDSSGGPREQAPMRELRGHKADILCLALGPNNILVTGSDDGAILLWNLESGTIKRRFDAPAPKTHHGAAAPGAVSPLQGTERSIEALAFLRDKLGFVFLSAGGDRHVRFWNSSSGALILDRPTGHRAGESITALAVTLDNAAVATGDSAGFIKVWDISRLDSRRQVTSRDEATATMREIAFFRAHQKGLTSVAFADLDGKQFLLTASRDCRVALWSKEGALIGAFGKDVWDVNDAGTWQSTTVTPVSETERTEVTPEISAWEMHHPKRAHDGEEEEVVSLKALLGQVEYRRRNRPGEGGVEGTMAERVYLPQRDRKLNFPKTAGRPSSSVAHLLHISALNDIAARPQTAVDEPKHVHGLGDDHGRRRPATVHGAGLRTHAARAGDRRSRVSRAGFTGGASNAESLRPKLR
ncbi:unnamed protein product [Pedinophyceae sp. YPF-701]|nr:unnamed protein product [Pedinophyceae sp. YPF-701]